MNGSIVEAATFMVSFGWKMHHLWIRFFTGILRVQFSHTRLVPAETVPVVGTGTYRPVISTVCHETRGVPFTRGYLQLY